MLQNYILLCLYFSVCVPFVHTTSNQEIDKDLEKQHLFELACKYGEPDYVNEYADDSRVDPSLNNNICIRSACGNGQTEVVRLLLRDPRVDPSANNNNCIRTACGNGHIKIVRLLLEHPKVDPSILDNWIIRKASSKGQTEVVELLLKHSKVDPRAESNWCIRTASANGHIETVRILLSDPRVDPSALQNKSIQKASADGHIGSDLRVDPDCVMNAKNLGLEDLIKMIKLVRAGNYLDLPNYITVSDLDVLVGNCKPETETSRHLRKLQVIWVKLRHPFEVFPGHLKCFLEANEEERTIFRDTIWKSVDNVLPLTDTIQRVHTQVLERAIAMLVDFGPSLFESGLADVFMHYSEQFNSRKSLI